jgi:Tol biopolymer transport system component
MTFAPARGTLLLTVVLAACQVDSTSVPAAPRSLLAADEAPQFSDWSTPVNLGPIVNSTAADFDPFISKDGLSLYFAAGRTRLPNFGGRDLWVAHRASIADPWGPPQNLGPTINTAAHESNPTLSVDGHRLYFTSNRVVGGFGDFDIYVSRRRDKGDDFGWEPPVNLGSAVNSTFSEEGAVALFEDETTGSTVMYFASNRRSAADFDIYKSILLPDGTFGPATFVSELSSASDDFDPAVRRDGLEMFLSSDRPGTNGAADLWVSTRATTADHWSTPVNLGSVVNSPPRPPDVEQSNDFRPALSFDGTALYFASALRPGNISGMFDLWVTTRARLDEADADDRRR